MYDQCVQHHTPSLYIHTSQDVRERAVQTGEKGGQREREGWARQKDRPLISWLCGCLSSVGMAFHKVNAGFG